ncbi:GNAT family N-acetyltransferase [Patescibacteria group bacterium]
MNERDPIIRPRVIPEADSPVQRFGPLEVTEMLNSTESHQVSVAVVELDGENEVGRNTRSDAAYYVLNGEGSFFLENDGEMQEHQVFPGDLVFIPRGVMYSDSGKMTLLAINTPSYDPESRGQGNAAEVVDQGVVIGGEYEHCEGGRYRVLGVELNATGYEEGNPIAPVVRYEQLYDGGYPKGTIWTRDLSDFQGTVDKAGEIVKFSLIFTKKEPVELVGEEITLTEFTLNDAEEVFNLIDRNRGHLSQHDDTTAKKYKRKEDVARSIAHPENPNRLRFAVRNRDGALVGSINLTPDEDIEGGAEIGYYLGSEFTGHGYMTKAVKLLAEYALRTARHQFVYGNVQVDNQASASVLTRNGFEPSGNDGKHISFVLEK